jgi:hypothetical protein
MCLTKQHYIARGLGFGQDWTSGLGHVKMTMLGFITSLHKSRTFKPWDILGIDSNATIFANHSTTLMCICVGECPTAKRSLANYIGNMATDSSLVRELVQMNVIVVNSCAHCF